ncbi:MAG: hypothetical protein KF847_17745 [Pirellulales bacterium]|nr:hypothetical protein [Pirellulales bacterium]
MKKKICLVRTVLTLGFLCFSGVASAALITSFETGDFDGWSAGTPFGSPTVVNSNRASDGVYSTESVFTVPANYGGWGVHALISRGTADIGITSGTTHITLDAYTNWDPAGWGVYGNEIQLLLNYEGFWGQISPSSGSLVNGSFATLTYDISAHAAAMTNPALSYSAVEVVWFLGTWQAGPDVMQTISIDNIHGNNLVPEPASVALSASCALAWCATRRRRMG